MYVDPGAELRRWDRYPAFANTAEVVAFRDVTGDGAPDVIVLNGGMVSVATANAAAPTSPWTVHPVSGPGYTVAAQHGLGAGDINGDGRVDVVTPYGWWEHPASGFAGHVAVSSGRVRPLAARGCEPGRRRAARRRFQRRRVE